MSESQLVKGLVFQRGWLADPKNEGSQWREQHERELRYHEVAYAVAMGEKIPYQSEVREPGEEPPEQDFGEPPPDDPFKGA